MSKSVSYRRILSHKTWAADDFSQNPHGCPLKPGLLTPALTPFFLAHPFGKGHLVLRGPNGPLPLGSFADTCGLQNHRPPRPRPKQAYAMETHFFQKGHIDKGNYQESPSDPSTRVMPHFQGVMETSGTQTHQK